MTFGSPVQSVQADDKPSPAAISMDRPTSPPTVSPENDIKHADLYFEVGRKGLTDEAKAQLQIHAESLKSDPNWGVLLQGHTDQQGSTDYNRKLGLRRAETVKEHLIGLGVPATSIKVVSLGKEGALCADTSDTCNRLNRRVHLEFRNIGAEHMVSSMTRPMASSNQHERVETSSTPSSFSDQATESTPAETPGISPEISPTDESAVGQK
jgi:peptidoglycan-associated lipoprotein